MIAEVFQQVAYMSILQADKSYSENCFTCLTNQGDLAIHSLPDLRRQVVQPSCIKKEDVVGIASLVFTPEGQAFFQVCTGARITLHITKIRQITVIYTDFKESD